MFYCDLRIELSAVCLYGLYRELDTLLLYYLLYTLTKNISSSNPSQQFFSPSHVTDKLDDNDDDYNLNSSFVVNNEWSNEHFRTRLNNITLMHWFVKYFNVFQMRFQRFQQIFCNIWNATIKDYLYCMCVCMCN